MARVASFREFAPLRIARDARVFVLTGAGISAESGISTFRDAKGLWKGTRVEDVASPQGWLANPDVVWRFYGEGRAHVSTCVPNVAHHALAALERTVGDRFFLCTQNVDDLHEKAGSARLVHMHGELFKSRCDRCVRAPFDDRTAHTSGPRCECGGRIRPHIVWFGEIPFDMERIEQELDTCDVFVTVGSSGAVYPAAGFVSAVNERSRSLGGARGVARIYVGPDEPDNAWLFDECRLGRATEVVPGLFDTA